jgi:hypothetical protein
LPDGAVVPLTAGAAAPLTAVPLTAAPLLSAGADDPLLSMDGEAASVEASAVVVGAVTGVVVVVASAVVAGVSEGALSDFCWQAVIPTRQSPAIVANKMFLRIKDSLYEKKLKIKPKVYNTQQALHIILKSRAWKGYNLSS